MNEKLTPKLYGWKDIAQYLGCSVSTAIRYKKVRNLPVQFLGKKPVGDPIKIDIWLEKNGEITPA